MKINNETKIGILALVGILALYFGFNFLKGKKIFSNEENLYAFYENIQGLTPSNPVIINGMQIGTVSSTDGGTDMRKIKVTIRLTKDVKIPDNSLAIINPGLLGGKSMEIKLGNSKNYLEGGDTLLTAGSEGIAGEFLKTLDPVLYEVRNAVKSLDSVLHIIGTTFDPATKNNIKQIVANMNYMSASLAVTSSHLERFMDPNVGHFARLMTNMNSFTGNLAAQNQKITTIMANADKTMANANVASARFAAIDLQPTLRKLDQTVTDLQAGLAKINSTEGSVGLLLNDKKLYNNLTATSNKINILLDDIRLHPKRYINFSVFGKKDNSTPLTAPLQDDSVTIILK
jgi:phospholipid/cholesterol/gamma-HCH transport system substrate-binding protein